MSRKTTVLVVCVAVTILTMVGCSDDTTRPDDETPPSITWVHSAGGASWDADLQRNTETATADGLDMFYGVGAAYAFTKALALTADWEVINSPNPEFSTLSLGFRWTFR